MTPFDGFSLLPVFLGETLYLCVSWMVFQGSRHHTHSSIYQVAGTEDRDKV